MKNPYFFNISWLTVTAIVIALTLYGPCLNSKWCFQFPEALENILIGIISSAILLVLTEIINYFVDRKKYGFLQKNYLKKVITEVNEGRARSDKIENKIELEFTNQIRYINDSIYHELLYYRCDKIEYITKLKYHHHGIYTGIVEYLDHTQSDLRNNKIVKTEAFITLNLNLANKMTGAGSFKYRNRDDFGKFEFQVDDQNPGRIIVSYINTIPSGLAEGYEVWVKR